ncbi:MAG: flavin reductase family protein [Anaerolineales bacterium]
MEISPATLPWQAVYKLLSGAVVPRPIGWISTIDAEGRPNLAPFSFFNVVCANPPTVLFCPMVRSRDAQTKDTLNNVRATGEFVVNIVTESLAPAMNLTAAELPPGQDEFAHAGLAKAPSHTVRPPRVAASPIHFECRLHQIIEISPEPGGGAVVLGIVQHIHVDENVLSGEWRIEPSALQPIGRMAGNFYTRTRELFELIRPI